MTGHNSFSNPSSPFELFGASLVLSLGLGFSLLGVFVLAIAASPLSDMMNRRQSAILGGTLFAMVAGSSYVNSSSIRAAWTLIALLYATGVPVLVTVASIRALVRPGPTVEEDQ